MAGVERFEDLIAWQKARELTKAVYDATLQGDLGRDFGLRDQMQKAAVSIMANLAEGFERGRMAEFHQYVSIAKSSCAELRSHLYVALDVGYLNPDGFAVLNDKAEELARILGGLRSSVARHRGHKTKP